MSSDNFYDILGIDANSQLEDIRKAYKRRALQTHPDRLPQGSTPEDKRLAEENFRRGMLGYLEACFSIQSHNRAVNNAYESMQQLAVVN
ncbi:hypothetical protein Clacol_005314 [Clathrus columnatus]|uniref:J domain-containing protein n=1 Tax=Clathrus columnatus TaxID=1419009 RepID=A0AAV5AEI6_9AGAM|nr:hypothetical protein Clacol_005314 [Clathrus columnatus]